MEDLRQFLWSWRIRVRKQCGVCQGKEPACRVASLVVLGTAAARLPLLSSHTPPFSNQAEITTRPKLLWSSHTGNTQWPHERQVGVSVTTDEEHIEHAPSTQKAQTPAESIFSTVFGQTYMRFATACTNRFTAIHASSNCQVDNVRNLFAVHI